jgi:hypothetical protein
VSGKHLRVIAIGVLVLLVLWGASERWSRRPDTIPPALRLPPVGAGAVDTILIAHGPDSVLLAKQPSGTWTVNRHPANQSGVDDLFQALGDSVRPELVAESPSSFARMGVDSASGRMVRLSGGGKPLIHMFVGDRGPGSDGSYVRLAGDSHVYLWAGRLPTVAQRAPDDWRDHQIGAVAPESIAVVEIQRGTKRTTLRKQGATWVLASGARADSSAVARLLDHFRKVTAAGFASERQADSLTFGRPERRVAVRGAAHTLLALVFDSTAGAFWARTPEGGAVYRLDFWQVDQLTPAEDALKSHP